MTDQQRDAGAPDPERHYHVDDLIGRIRGALVAAGVRLDAVTIEDLAPVDAFHMRGRQETAELAAAAGISAGQRVVDIGSGLGGTARYLAATTGCTVTGVDATESFCRAATELSAWVGLSDATRFLHGSALALPMGDASFDVAWTEHVQMSIPDKELFYREASRVLVAGGQFLFHDIFQGPGGPPHVPVPWADEASDSALCTPEQAAEAMRAAGFEIVSWTDTSEASRAFFEQAVQRIAEAGPPALGLHLLMPREPARKMRNLLRNLTEKRTVGIQGVLRRR